MPIESLLAYHCGPALAGIKPANIVSCSRAENPNFREVIQQLNTRLNGQGIYFDILCECRERILVMVYRRKKLEEYLTTDSIHRFLVECGYPQQFDLKDYIGILKSRIRDQHIGSSEFPHEIGAFLGYPIHDIYGFIHHKDKGCLMTGEWKVYANAEQAEQLFQRYKKCRKAILNRINSGKTLEQLFCIA